MIRPHKASSGSGTSNIKKSHTKLVPDPVCRYKNRVCHQPVLDKYEYCLKHILEDKNAPYKPCGYPYPNNNKRCLVPALKGEKSDIGYCSLHTWKTQIKSQRSTSKHVPPTTPEFLLSGLSHYVKPVRNIKSEEGEEVKSSSRIRAIDPFVETDVTKASQTKTNVLECDSESDSDVEPATLDNIWKGANEDSSDAESIDSQADDPLKHAGYYTSEEAVNITRSKLIRLQVLYQRQFERLTYLLKEKRRHYLHSLRKEKETLSSIYDQAKTSAKEQKLYEKLKALNRYHKRSNNESLAYLASIEKRARDISGGNYKPHGHSQRCAFTEGGVRCTSVTIPLTKYCFKHILHDPNQCLFKACGCAKADTSCQVPVTGLCTGETCILHIRLPVLPHLNYPDGEIKSESEDKRIHEDSDEIDASATESAFSTDNRDSPENSIIHNDDSVKKEDESNFSEQVIEETVVDDVHENVIECSTSKDPLTGDNEPMEVDVPPL